MRKYKNWSKVLIEPQTLNEARLHVLETKINQEEEVREKEYRFMQDIIRKLIFSFEQDTKL